MTTCVTFKTNQFTDKSSEVVEFVPASGETWRPLCGYIEGRSKQDSQSFRVRKVDRFPLTLQF
jgi:hypothetical protein